MTQVYAPAAMGAEAYNDKVVRQFAIATLLWGIVGMSVGALIAAQLIWPSLSFDLPWLGYGRLRPLHTNAVIFAYGGSALFGTSYYVVQRTCHVRLFSDALSAFTFWGWQAVIVLAAITLPMGWTTAKEYAELEWPIDLLIAVVWVAYLIVFFGTLVKRRVSHIYVANWFYECSSDHPIAAAFTPYLTDTLHVHEPREIAGRGVEGMLSGRRWRLGRRDFVAELHPASQAADASQLVLGNDSGVVAEFALEDPIRPGTARAVTELKALGLEIVIASGDRQSAVESVAQCLELPEAFGQMTPQQKLAFVEREQSLGRRILMIGDGINDGPVLAAAYVSCALAQGAAVAQAAADLLLLKESLGSLADAVRRARHTLRIMRQNLIWAFCYNIAAVPAAALGWVPPWMAAIGMSASSLAVALNAARLARPSP